MKKVNNSKIYIIILSVLFCIMIAYLIRYLFSKREIYAFISSYEIYKGESISYSDSTFRAKDWLWEFGDGNVSYEKEGKYKYTEVGTYQLRLTVNQSLRKEFIINVRTPVKLERDSLIRIEAPHLALQDEILIFRGIGLSKEWRWSFGETGIIDSREQVVMYAYKLPGTYEVELMTEDTKYPIRHTIEILPKYMENDTTDVLSLVGNDIREHLQAIVDGEPFNPHYNHIMTKYLCNNPDVLVTINNDKKNDFYSYCQGLKIIGRKNTNILEIIVVVDENRPGCLQKLFVMQNTRSQK